MFRPRIWHPGCFTMENPMKMDDLGAPPWKKLFVLCQKNQICIPFPKWRDLFLARHPWLIQPQPQVCLSAAAARAAFQIESGLIFRNPSSQKMNFAAKLRNNTDQGCPEVPQKIHPALAIIWGRAVVSRLIESIANQPVARKPRGWLSAKWTTTLPPQDPLPPYTYTIYHTLPNINKSPCKTSMSHSWISLHHTKSANYTHRP